MKTSNSDRLFMYNTIIMYYTTQIDSIQLDDRIMEHRFEVHDSLCEDIINWLYYYYDDTKRHFWYSFFDKNAFRVIMLWISLLEANIDWVLAKSEFLTDNTKDYRGLFSFLTRLSQPLFDWNAATTSSVFFNYLNSSSEHLFYPPISEKVINQIFCRCHLFDFFAKKRLIQLLLSRDPIICNLINNQKSRNKIISLKEKNNYSNYILPNDSPLLINILK